MKLEYFKNQIDLGRQRLFYIIEIKSDNFQRYEMRSTLINDFNNIDWTGLIYDELYSTYDGLIPRFKLIT